MRKSAKLLTAMSLGIAVDAHAQEAEDATRINEIVVTAQFREQNLQDVPIAISAVTGDTMEAAGVASTDDLAMVSTGVTIRRQTGAALIFMRGVGTAGGQAAQEGAVATFIDGVYQPSPSSATMALANLERVEIVKGPQGTLYGRNATAGAINIITLKPSFDPTAKLRVGYGNKDTVEASAYVSSGITGGIAADLSLYYQYQGDGWGVNLRNGHEIHKGRDLAVRSKVLIEPADGTTITLAGDYNKYDGSAGVPQRVYPGAVLIDGQTNLPGGFYDVWADIGPSIVFEGYGFSGTIEQDIGDVKLTSISAYRNLEIHTLSDSDGAIGDVTSADLIEKNYQFTQELRLQGDVEKFQWTLGGFYLKGKAGYDPFTVFGSGIRAGFGGTPLSPDLLTVFNSGQKTTSISGFGQATYALSDDTNFTAGIRYTRDKRDFNPEGYLGFTAVPGLLIPVPFALTNGAVTDPTDFFKDSRTYEKVTWRLSIDHKFGEDLLGYASYNRGFKSGIFNSTSIVSNAVEPEVLDAFEVGFKSTLVDGRLHLNGAAYYYDYSNIQLTLLTGASQLLLNAATAEIYGAEMEFDLQANDNFSLRGGIAYTHGRYSKFDNVPVFTQAPAPQYGSSVTFGDGSGNSTVFSPEWQANIAANYTIPVGDDEINANVGLVYTSEYFFTPDNNTAQDDLVLVNASLNYKLAGGMKLSLWGRNLSDEKYFASAYNAPAGKTYVAAPGRTFGVTIGFDY